MTREGKGKIVERGGKYKKFFLYIPKSVASDTNFPFQVGENVTVRINGNKLVIEKRENPKNQNCSKTS